MLPPADDVEHRMPVWQAMSDLFLDREFPPDHLAVIARILRASGYSPKDLEKILWYEVFPVCIPSMLCVAGEWGGFDGDWLKRCILDHQRSWRWWFTLIPRRLHGLMIRKARDRIKQLLLG